MAKAQGLPMQTIVIIILVVIAMAATGIFFLKSTKESDEQFDKAWGAVPEIDYSP